MFWVFAPISVASAIGMVVMRNAVHAALFLVVNFFTIAVMYLLLDAPFLFAVQIIVYTGAIMVLFLFVIMLLGVDRGEPMHEPLIGQRALAVILAVGHRRWRSGSRCAPGSGSRPRAPDGFDVVNKGGNAQALAERVVPRLLLPVRGDVGAADHRGDGRDGAGAAEVARDHAGRDATRIAPTSMRSGTRTPGRHRSPVRRSRRGPR